jgi:hypothetical protein
MFDPMSILSTLDLDGLINAAVEKKIAEREHQIKVNAGNSVVEAATRVQASPPPPKFLKHYRCDTSPNLVIHARTIVDGVPHRSKEWSTDAKAWRDPDPLAGKRIQFRRGHFFATEQWQVDLMEWKMSHPSIDPSSGAEAPIVVGGNPSIYEDDGINNVGDCEYGCGLSFVPGSNAYKAHLRATHGVGV